MLKLLLSPATRVLLAGLSVGAVFPQNASHTGKLLVQKAARASDQAVRQLIEQREAQNLNVTSSRSGFRC